MGPNERLLKLIKARQEKKTEFNYGILTADRYVKTVQQCVGSDLCYRYAAKDRSSFQDVIDKAARTLAYANPEMELENAMTMQGAINYWKNKTVRVFRDGQWKQVSGSEIEIPKKSLMMFKHVLTTPRKDRDGDILRTQGATVDPKMLLLWQHVHTLPIGKMLAVAEHTPEKLSLISVIIDMNELCHDAATMIEAGMGRFSHGFRALEFDELKEEEGETTSPGGFDIKKFEIMEASLVSVPSNTDAETEDILLELVEGGKLTSRLMKATGEQIRANRPIALTFNLTDDQIKRLKIESSVELGNDEEVSNEDKPRGGSPKGEGQKEGCSCSPKEADDKDRAEAAKEASDTEVKAMVGMTSEDDGHSHRVTLDDDGNGMTSTDEGHRHQVVEFEVEEADGHSHSISKGDLEERSVAEGEKAGRTLSARNLQRLKDVKDDMEELMEKENMSRGGGALCTRCVKVLEDIIQEAGGYEDEDKVAIMDDAKTVGVTEAISIILAESSRQQRIDLFKLLGTIQELEDQHQQAEQLNALLLG